MPNGTYGGVRGRKTKVGRKLLRFPPTRLTSKHGKNLVTLVTLSRYAARRLDHIFNNV